MIGLVRAGDINSALQHLMQRHGTAVYRYCCAALRDPVLADDVHQRVFLEVFRDLPRFAGRSPVRIWLFAIARHRVTDAARKRNRTPACVDDALTIDVPDPRPLPVESIDEARLLEALAASLQELDERVRNAVLLRYQQGFTFEEMAVICREKAATLNARVNRALPLLRAAIRLRLDDRHDRGRGAARISRALGIPAVP